MKLTYLFDPLCGWCYGAAPVLDKLVRLDRVAVELAPTGLFSGTGARPMDDRFASYAWQNDQRISHMTGQVFSTAYRDQVLARTGSMFDSAPATLGIVAVGLTMRDREREALNAIQQARYVDGRNNSESDVVADVLKLAGFTEAADLVLQPDDVLLKACHERIATARELMTQFHANGVPVLLAGQGDRRRKLDSSLLYGDFDLLEAELQAA